MPKTSIEQQTKKIVYLIRRLMQSEELYTKELNKVHHISGPQLACILALHEHGSLSLSEIAKEIMVKSSTVTGIVDRLEQKGLVRRVRTSRDRRVITIELTEEGQVLADHAPPPIQQKIVEGLKTLPDEDVEQIVDGLTRLTELLDVAPTRIPGVLDGNGNGNVNGW
ncbi:MAG: MarR family winged helix-turn-helix transcriptional regulator [Desulfatibacillaceae bacterium]